MKKLLASAQPLSLLAALLAIGIGCRAQSTDGNEGHFPVNDFSQEPLSEAPSRPAPILAPPFKASAHADKAEYKVGETIGLSITVTNTSKYPAQLQFTSGQRFDFVATLEGEEEAAWTWSADKRFAQSLSSQMLEPGQELSFDAKWTDAKAGKYRVVGLITANGKVTAPAFEISVN